MEIKLNEFYNMDCAKGLDLMIEQGMVVDGVLTSPPYNIIRPRSDRKYDVYDDRRSNEEYIDWIVSLFDKMDKVIRPNGKIIWNMSYGGENSECMSLTIADIIVWKKSNAVPNNMSKNKLTRICEFVYVFVRKDEFLTFDANKELALIDSKGCPKYKQIINYVEAKNNDLSTTLNKATYSTELCNKLMNIYFRTDESVMDIFGGTGTTAIACYRRGNPFVYFELSKDQTEFAKNRYREESSQIRMEW